MLCWIETGHQTAWKDMDTVVWMKCNNASLNKPHSTLINNSSSNLDALQLCILLNNGTMCVNCFVDSLCTVLNNHPSCDFVRGQLTLVFVSSKPNFKN